jgi:protein-S-isoprenylcysteine O-methyltransferase Ste14
VIVLRALLFILVATGLVLVGLPYLVLTTSGPASHVPLGLFRWLSVPLAAAALAVYLMCVSDFITAGRGTPAPYDPPRDLVSGRLYARVRNPMYLSLLTLIVAEAIFLESRSLLVYAAVVWLVSHLFVILYEEPTLAHRFGASYDAYRSSVPRWLPRLSPGRGRESESRA